ncbi:hypothetical protein BCR43DRAFT_490557 [Syncephalastrum racemosum]|uniref:HNH domain-containing protein n=1 Tax=Syncephalastrum racemosum TaxID=13706 RepID=A0A1X2HG68_SYNRA|nr:hypothetical protein BCR43DRAFT_490557 [Syncephalastrum racemosum]
MPRTEKAVAMPSRKSNVIYENWTVYSKQGKRMFRCSLKKADWYLARDLAKRCETEEKAIQLTFEPKGQGHSESDYMMEDRLNQCVACASTKGLTLHHVVPDVYRRCMPLNIKSKSSRDLLLLCKQCHDQYERHAMALKKALAVKYDVPLEGKGWVMVPENRIARKAASALLRPDSVKKIPEARLAELKRAVEAYCQDKEEWNCLPWDQILVKCCELKDMYPGPEFAEHGQTVVSELMKEELIEDGHTRWPQLEQFIREWRLHFLKHAQPKYLSSRWGAENEIYTH